MRQPTSRFRLTKRCTLPARSPEPGRVLPVRGWRMLGPSGSSHARSAHHRRSRLNGGRFLHAGHANARWHDHDDDRGRDTREAVPQVPSTRDDNELILVLRPRPDWILQPSKVGVDPRRRGMRDP
jgi:hypothetical protein